MTTKQERLCEVYNYLRAKKGIHTQVGFAEALHITRPAISAALNGNESYLTKNLFQKICGAFPGVFNLDYLLTGQGELLIASDDSCEQSLSIKQKSAPVDKNFYRMALENDVNVIASNAVVDKVSKTITWGSVRDTFWNVDSLNIRANTSESTSKTITLSRVVGRAILQLTDVVPEGAQQVTFKPSHWYYGLCYLNGKPTADSDAEIAVDIPASYIGQQGLRVSYMSLSSADDWTTGMAIAMKGAGDGVLGSVTLSDVLMGRNKTVTMTGALLSATRSLGVNLNDTWGDSNEMTW